MQIQLIKHLAFGFLFFAALFLLVNFFRPLLPIDETRYVTVAWEMWSKKDFILPTLNFAAYSHKPPFLFWLINIGWFLFGVNDWAIRLVPFLSSIAVIVCTYFLALSLWSENKIKAFSSCWIVLCMSGFLFYNTLVMFDCLLTAFILLGHIALLRHRWILYGISLGFALLTKGPVAEIYLGLVPLCAPFYLSINSSWKKWYRNFFLAQLLGSIIILAWAIPAAIKGGELYRQAIFIHQTTGRLVDSFAHQKPFWYYLVALPLFTFPWFFWWPFWKNLPQLKWKKMSWQKKYLLSFIVISFMSFSFFSGKQIHYLFPTFPILGLFFVDVVDQKNLLTNRWFIVNCFVILLCVLGKEFLFLSKPEVGLTDIVSVIKQYQPNEIAYNHEYRGEIGYLARLEKPVQQIELKDISSWLINHPKGLVVAQYNLNEKLHKFKQAKIIFSQKYRSKRRLEIWINEND